MFTESENCILESYGYNSKQNRLHFILTQINTGKDFQTGFINVAAYSCYKRNIGQTVVKIKKVDPEILISESWNNIASAVDNIWPNSQSKSLTEAISDISTFRLNGYMIEFSGKDTWWVISQNYLLLGKAPNS